VESPEHEIAAPASSTDQDPSAAFEESLEVSAQHRPQDIHRVPVSVQSVDREEILRLGATELGDLEHFAPSLAIGGMVGTSNQAMGMRGVVDFSRNTGIESSLGVYVDGVYQGRSHVADQPLLGLERVELLRGPQGTLFGKNTVSGAVHLVTRPLTSRTELDVLGEIGSSGYTRAAAYLAGPLSQTVLGSLAVGYDRSDGYYRSVVLGRDTGGQERGAARGKLRVLPTDRIELILSGDVVWRHSHLPAYTRRSLPAFQTQQGFEAADEVDAWGTSLTLNAGIGSGYTLTSITAWRESSFDLNFDDDLSPAEVLTAHFDETSDQFTQELRLVSPETDRFDWLAGIFYFDVTNGSDRYSMVGPDLFRLRVPSLAAYAEALSGRVSTPNEVDVRTGAAYVHGTYRLGDRWSLTAGLRYTVEEKSVDWRQVNAPDDLATAQALERTTGLPLSQAPGALLGFVDSRFVGDRSEDDLSPTVALTFEAREHTTLFGRYARGFKSGGFNADFMSAGLDHFEYDAESVDSWEVGVKSSPAGGRLLVNATAFLAKYEGFQVFQFLVTSSGATTLQLTNAGEATSQGIEVESRWRATRRLELQLNFTLLDAGYDVFENPDPASPDFDGNKLPYAPDVKAFLGLRYVVPLGDRRGALAFDASYSYVDTQFSDPSNGEDYRVDAYDVIDARIGWEPPKGGWRVELWGRNLTDDEYALVNNLSFLGTPRTVWAAPRTVGLSLAFSY